MTKRILLTGGTGALGKRLVLKLLATGYQLVVISRDATLAQSASNITYIQADITIKDALAQTLSDVEFDTVLHLAAITHSHNKNLYYKVNVEGTRNLVGLCESRGAVRFVHMSSRAAHEQGGAYAHSKLLAEKVVKESRLEWVILKPSEIYGGSPREAISTLLRLIKRYHIAPIIGSGEYHVAPLWVDDCIQAILRAAVIPQARQSYNLSGPEDITYNTLIDTIAHFLHTRALKVHVPIPLARIAAWLARMAGSTIIVDDQIDRLVTPKSSDITAARRDLNFNPCSLAEGLTKLKSSV